MDLTVRGLFAQLLQYLTKFDNQVLNTLRTLITSPGALTLAFQRGQRTPFLGPIKVFVLANLLFFAIQTLSELRVFAPALAMHLLDEPWTSIARQLVDHHLAEAGSSLAA